MTAVVVAAAEARTATDQHEADFTGLTAPAVGLLDGDVLLLEARLGRGCLGLVLLPLDQPRVRVLVV